MKISIRLSQEGVCDAIFLNFEIDKTELNAQICSVSDTLADWIQDQARRVKLSGSGIKLKANRDIDMRIQAGTKVVLNTQTLKASKGIDTLIKFNSVMSKQGKIKLSRKIKFAMSDFVKDVKISNFGDDVLTALEQDKYEELISKN